MPKTLVLSTGFLMIRQNGIDSLVVRFIIIILIDKVNDLKQKFHVDLVFCNIHSKKCWVKENCPMFTQLEGDYVSDQLLGKLKILQDLPSVG